MQLKKMTESDLNWTAQILKIEFGKPPYNEKWTNANAKRCMRNSLNSNSTHCYKIIQGKENIGFVCFNDIGWEPEGKTCFLDVIAIDEKHQHKGIGNWLLKELGKLLKEKKFKGVRLIANREFFAHAWYLKNGFRETKYTLLKKELK